MFELFWAMVKEEWRVHSTMFGSLSFALFPVMIFGIAFMGSFLIPLVKKTLPLGNLAIIIHAMYLMLGLMVGGFGMLGNEMMNRRFGQASFLAYSARSLPLSERIIFANFVVKDTVYYFFLWVFPFGFGYVLASPFIGAPLTGALFLLLTLTLSFLFGLCGIFFLSTVFAWSKPVFWAFLLLLGIGFGGIMATGMNPALLFPPLLLHNEFSWTNLLLSCIVLAYLFTVSLWLFNPESVGSEKKYPGPLHPLAAAVLVPAQSPARRQGHDRPVPEREHDWPDPLLVPCPARGDLVLPLADGPLLPAPRPALPVRCHHGRDRLDHVHVGHDVRQLRAVRLPARICQHAHLEQAHHVYHAPGHSGRLYRGCGNPRGRGGVSSSPRSCSGSRSRSMP